MTDQEREAELRKEASECVRAGEITTTQAYNLLTNDLNEYIGNIVSGEQLYVIRYFRGKIDEIFEAVTHV